MAHDLPPSDLPPPDAAHALERFRARALALPADEIVKWFGTPGLLVDNTRRAAQAVLAERSLLEKQLPNADWQRVEEAPDLATAAWQAFALADRTVEAPQRPFEEHRTAVSTLRTRLLAAAEYLATSGAVAKAEVAAVRHGTGSRDLGEDVLALVHLLSHAGSPATALVPQEELEHAQVEATAFVARLRPSGRLGDAGKKGAAAEAAELRDRVFTLAVQAHGEAWRVGAWRWGREVEKHVPGLGTRRV
jgi:hypothetical protein